MKTASAGVGSSDFRIDYLYIFFRVGSIIYRYFFTSDRLFIYIFWWRTAEVGDAFYSLYPVADRPEILISIAVIGWWFNIYTSRRRDFSGVGLIFDNINERLAGKI